MTLSEMENAARLLVLFFFPLLLLWVLGFSGRCLSFRVMIKSWVWRGNQELNNLGNAVVECFSV